MRSHRSAAILAFAAITAAIFLEPARAQDTGGAISSQTLPSTPGTDPSRVLGNGVAPPAPNPAPPPSAPASPGAATGAAAPTTSDWLIRTTGDFMVLDKIYGVSSQATVTVGQAFKVRSLTIKVLACLVRPPTTPPDTAAFLEVSDGHAAAGAPPVFRGWVFKSEPGLSGLADPVTDIGVSDCR